MRQGEPLTLDGVPEAMLRELGLSPRRGRLEGYRCEDPAAVLVPIKEILAPPTRKLNEQRLRSILEGIRDGANLPPVMIFRDPGAVVATLLAGMHRFRASEAVGFRLIPALVLTREETEGGYSYA